MSKEKEILTREEAGQASGGIDISKYSEADLARIFDTYIEMYGISGAIPYLADFGVTTGDIYLVNPNNNWDNSPYKSGSNGSRLAHLVFKRNH